MMTSPKYEWVCQNCLSKNAPGMERCAACGFFANFTKAQLEFFQPKSKRMLSGLDAYTSQLFSIVKARRVYSVLFATLVPPLASLAPHGHGIPFFELLQVISVLYGCVLVFLFALDLMLVQFFNVLPKIPIFLKNDVIRNFEVTSITVIVVTYGLLAWAILKPTSY
jgi:hypothetical protein